MKTLLTLIEDVGSLLLVAMALPFVILLLGTPVALFVRFVLEIVQRF